MRQKYKGKGQLRKDLAYVSYRTVEHYFRKFDGFGISTSILKSLRSQGCTKIVIIYQDSPDTQTKYETSPDNFFRHGFIWCDRETDWQRILPLRFFKRTGQQVLEARDEMQGIEQRWEHM